MENEADLVGERRTATGAIGDMLRLMQLDQVFGLAADVYWITYRIFRTFRIAGFLNRGSDRAMSDDDGLKAMGQVIQIDEARILDHLGEMVRGTVEETLNELLHAEADRALVRDVMNAVKVGRIPGPVAMSARCTLWPGK